jgi:sialate O-acetylesterase
MTSPLRSMFLSQHRRIAPFASPTRVRVTSARRYAWSRADDVTIFASAPSPWDLPFFSAICLFFGYRHHKATGVPVGLISSNFGGTKIEMWSSRQAIQQCPPPQMPSGGFQEPPTVFEYPKICLEPALSGGHCSMSFYAFGSLYYGMIAPITQQKLKGVLWYQGESNIGASSMYKCQLQALVADYRRGFAQPDLPFIVAQLCPTGLATSEFDWTIARRDYNEDQIDAMRRSLLRNTTSNPLSYTPIPPLLRSSSFLRLSQELALTLPNTALAVTADLGDRNSSFGSIHPRNKREIARRLYLEFSGMLQADATTIPDQNGGALSGQVACRWHIRPCFGVLEFSGVDSVIAVKFVSMLPIMFNGTAFCMACCTSSPFEIM